MVDLRETRKTFGCLEYLQTGFTSLVLDQNRPGALTIMAVMIMLSTGALAADYNRVERPTRRLRPTVAFTTNPNPERLVVHDGETFPVDQMMVMLERGQPQALAKQIAGLYGGSVVGQIPVVGIYQLELPFTAVGQVLEAVEQVRSLDGVAAVTYNRLSDMASAKEECPPESDSNDNLIDVDDRCAMQGLYFLQMLTIFENIRDEISFDDSFVAIIDSGIDLANSPHFAEMHRQGRLTDLFGGSTLQDNAANAPNPAEQYHGTKVASVIAAADDGKGISGVASRVLGPRLHLTVGAAGSLYNGQMGIPLSQILEGIARAAMVEHADIVNLSFGGPISVNNLAQQDELLQYEVLVKEFEKDLLFVAAAGNARYVLDGDNFAPGGIDAPNFITVGSSQNCRPGLVNEDHGRGAIDAVAPGENVPVEHPITGLMHVDGSSYATAYVTAVAAILKSLDPSMSPARLKEVIIGTPLIARSDGGNQPYSWVTLYHIIGEYLRKTSTSSYVVDLLRARDSNDLEGSLGWVLNRLCGWVWFDVEDHGEHEFSFEEYFHLQSGFGWEVDVDSFLGGGIHLPDDSGFEVWTNYPFNLNDALPLTGAIVWMGQGDCAPVGNSYGIGEITINDCWIDQMDERGDGWDPSVLTMTGRISTSVNMFEDPCNDPLNIVTREVTVEFEAPVAKQAGTDPDDLLRALCPLGRKKK